MWRAILRFDSMRTIDYYYNLQNDIMRSLASVKPTVNRDDLSKLEKFTSDFGQEG